jgi:hypothetical protein
MVLQALIFVLCLFEFLYSHFPVTSGRLDQFSGTYFNKCLRIALSKESIRLGVSLTEDRWRPELRHVVLVTKFRQ